MTEFYKTCYRAILAQRSSIADTIKSVDLSQADTLRSRKDVVFVGCGDSYAVADYGRWCMSVAGISSLCLSPDETRYVPIGTDTIVVGVTASGRSLVTIDALRRAKSKGAEIVVLTDNPQGKAVEYADHVWTTMAGVSTYDTSPSSPTTTAMAYLLRLVGGIESKCQDKVERDIAKLKSNGRQMLAWAEQEGEDIGKS
ncbi:SIS domain-containing protein, partial [Candidatus Thorarchaeota archaeon]